MSTIEVLNSTGETVDVQLPVAPGQATSALSKPVVIASDQSDLPVKPGSSETIVTGASLGSGGVGYLGWLSQIAETLAGTLTVATHAVTQSGSWVLSAGSAIVGKVGIDQTTPGTTNGVQVNAPLPAGTNSIGQVTANAGTNLNTSALALESGGNLAAAASALGVTTGAAVITDANGTLQQFLRGIVKLLAAGISVNSTIVGGVLSPGAAASADSAPAVIASDQATLAVAPDISQVLNGKAGVSLTPATAQVNISSATTTANLIPAVSGKQIRVLAAYLVLGGANNVNWRSHTTTSNGDAGLPFAANGGFVLPFNPVGWFDTTSGEGLDIVTSTSAQLSGRIIYVAH